MGRRSLSRLELTFGGLCIASLLWWLVSGSERGICLMLGFASILFILRVCSRDNRNA